jgi:GNAT superfamily N-acetyltransferase
VELKRMEFERFVAWRNGQPVGTIIPHIHHAYNEFQQVNAGWFGQFEVLNDREAGHALLATAEEWVRARGADRLMGPATFSTNSEIGMLVEGFDTPPMIMMSHARPYYREFVESYGGFETSMDLWAWYFDGNQWGGIRADRLPEKLTRVVEKIRQRRNFTLRNPNMRRLNEELVHLKAIYNQAWARNWGFVPLNDEEINHIADGIKDILDPRIAFFVEVEGKPVAFGLPLPNIYEPLRKARCKPGEPAWWQLLRLLWHWKIAGKLTSVRAWGLGVLEEYRATGVDALMYYEMIKTGLPLGYKDIEMSWILANNDKMNRVIEMLGATIYKTYRVWEKAL